MRRWVKVGTTLGFAAGVIVFAGYVVASWWVCTTLRQCPGHWFPYLVIFCIGTSIFTLMGFAAAAVLRGMYQITRVDTDD